MKYELLARKIVDKAIIYIKAHPEQKFGAAQVALDSVSEISSQAFNDKDENTSDIVVWHRALLDKINDAALQ